MSKMAIISLLREVDEGKYSNIALNEYFKKNDIKKGERGFITEVFYGVIRNKIFIDRAISNRTKAIKKDWILNMLRLSIYQITYMKSDNKGVVWEATELTKKKFGDNVGKFVNGVLRNYIRTYEEEMKELEESKSYDILFSFPKWVYDMLSTEFGEDTEKVLKSLKKIPYTSFRVNQLKYSVDEFEEFIASMGINIIKKVDTVYYLDSGIMIYSDEFKEGKIIIQDASSYLAAKNLNPKPFDDVIDACGAPGGKSVVLAELMNNEGEILSLDIYDHKIKLIDENCQKLGATNVKAIKMDARKLHLQGKKFDKILVDAPCSGYGVVSKKPELIYSKKADNLENLCVLQFEILESASKVLKDDGELVYSTCTILKKENSDVIEKFLEKYPEFKTTELYIPENVKGTYDKLGGFSIDFNEEILDGFYIVKIKRKEK